SLSLLLLTHCHSPAPHRCPHASPTRRSSDLAAHTVGGLQVPRHGVERLGELTDLVLARRAHADGVVAVGHRLRGGRHLPQRRRQDRKSTRLNSSHVKSSYAVFCLKQKN